MADEIVYQEIGERLASVRSAFSNLSQKDWSNNHGFGRTQWNNWEKGTRRIPLESAQRLCSLYGQTFNFIYGGRLDGLSASASKSLFLQNPIAGTISPELQ